MGRPVQVTPDRFGNPYWTDAQQVESLYFTMRSPAMFGFEGTDQELWTRAEAWWFGDWTDHRCPSLDEAQRFLANIRRDTVPANSDVRAGETVVGRWGRTSAAHPASSPASGR